MLEVQLAIFPLVLALLQSSIGIHSNMGVLESLLRSVRIRGSIPRRRTREATQELWVLLRPSGLGFRVRV